MRARPSPSRSSPRFNSAVTNNPTPLDAEQIAALVRIFGADGVLTDSAECWPYGYDNSRRHALPAAVVFATRHEQVEELVRLCHDHLIPLVARGRGSGTTGATVPTRGGIVLSLERMNRILAIDADNRLAVVEPGVTNQALQDAAAEKGFFWPPDPTSAAFCTIGGNLAYNSAGPRAVKYGTPRENTLALRAVNGRGQSLRTGSRTTKGVVGLDLTRLLIGSEGTLAIITEATLKLTPLTETKHTLQAIYRDMHSAASAVSAIMAQPVTPCALEFIDGQAIEMIRNFSQAELPQGAGAMLMIEVDGPRAGIDEARERVAEAARNEGLLSLNAATSQAETAALWATRKALSPAQRKIAPKKINEDVVVPVASMAELIDGLGELSQRFGITIVNFGHAGNGNIHVNLLVNPDDAEEMARAERCLDEVFGLVLALGGTISGEHGIGLEKRDFVSREVDEVSLEMMRQVKAVFDPANILNADKALPQKPGSERNFS